LGRVGDAQSFPELDAFRRTIESHGLVYKPQWVWENEHLSDHYAATNAGTNQEQGFRATFETFGTESAKRGETPDGLVILDDMMARGAMVALQQLDIRPGREVRIAAHANQGSTVLAGFESQLIRVEIDPEEIIQAMFDMLEALMDGKSPRKHTIAVKPHVRR
jgi:DNA-binding LacI/PurR family transcriptional regulator